MKSIPLKREVIQHTRKYILGIPFQKRTAHIFRRSDEAPVCGQKYLVLIYRQGFGSHYRTPNVGDPMCPECVKIVMRDAEENEGA